MEHYTTALLAAIFLGYAIVASKLTRSMITGPMLFTGLGLLLGPQALDLVHFDLDTQVVETLLSITLALLLFADATRVDLGELVRSISIPGRLLAISLPLTIALGAIAALGLFGDLDIWQAALIGAILAPTDAALGQAVVTNPRVPLRVRQGLNIESGLNDGVVLPFVTIFLVVAESGQDALSGSLILHTLAEDLGIGAGIGVGVGVAAGFAVVATVRRGWLTPTWLPFAVVATPALVFGIAEPLGGSGFVAAFVAGLVFGRIARDLPTSGNDFTDDLAQLLVPATFLIYGGAVLGSTLERADWAMLGYVALSLTVVRMVPTALALLGNGLRRPTVALMAWFGPRGLASILFVVIIVGESGQLQGVARLTDIVALTVAVSIVAHGITAWPLSNRYADWVEAKAADGHELAETESVRHLVSRRYFEKPRSRESEPGRHLRAHGASQGVAPLDGLSSPDSHQ